jgi:L-glyceraldehyde 3-phosphate reductase
MEYDIKRILSPFSGVDFKCTLRIIVAENRAPFQKGAPAANAGHQGEKMKYEANKDRYESMKYNRSGKSGLKLPLVSLGLWHNFGTNDNYANMKAMCHTAFDRGITHFDLANNYGPEPGSAEANFGKILRDSLGRYRDELIISTKAGYGMWSGPYGDGGSRKYLLASLDQSLKRMGVEYVDIFYHHRMDPETPIEESMCALDQAVKSGKALYAGISNYDGERTVQAMEILKSLNCPFVINQSAYSIFNRNIENNGLKKVAVENGIGIIAFSPLAQGLLTGRYLDGIPSDSRIARSGRFLKAEQLTPEKLAQIRALNAIAESRGQSLAQMALSWVLKDGAVTSVLIGASKPGQVTENLGIINRTTFTPEELSAIDRAAGIQQ